MHHPVCLRPWAVLLVALVAPLLLAAADAPAVAPAAVAPSSTAAAPRPATWAKPLDLPGCPNLHQVGPTLYRGAQPTAEGLRHLRDDLGVKTIICLRAGHSDAKLIAGLGLAYVPIRMRAWDAETEDIVAFLRVVTDPTRGPFFVHCQHGADRTGTCSAAYRIYVEGWDPAEAAREMTDGGYGFHSVWGNLLRYVQHLDRAKLQRQMDQPADTGE